MITLDEIKISYYASKFAKKNDEVSVYQFIMSVITGRWKEEILSIRRYFQEGDVKSADKLKGNLPCVTFGGVFKGAHTIAGLTRPSGLITLDLDDVEDLPRVAELCKADPHTALAFRSPTNGYKVSAYVEGIAGHHREAYRLVASYYARLTGLKVDESGKDESRLCFASYDPNGYMAVFYESFVLEKLTGNDELLTVNGERRSEERLIADSSPLTVPSPFSAGSAVNRFLSSYIFLNPIVPGNRDNSLFKLGCEAAKRGYEMKTVWSELLPYFNYPDFDEKDVFRPLKSGYKSFKGRTDELSGGMVKGNEKFKCSNVQSGCLENDEAQEEGYWIGEELRKQTPLFPDELYDNLPEGIAECIIENITPREKDILLLSVLGAFSSIFPNTWGTYDGKRFTPNLFIIGIAPAGSGKSIAKLGGELLEKINDYIIGESEQALKQYKASKTEWVMACARKNRSKESEQESDGVGEEPQEPPYKMLVIPSTTSYTRLQMQLRDNGDGGSIIFDTEAQTMANANSLDCGHFEDMLCKAFGHETISSSYKINGMRPIIIRRPALSVMLTGTNEQIYLLIKKPEHGLLSRFLVYTYRDLAHWKEMGGTETVNDDLFEELSVKAFSLYKHCKEHPMGFRFTRQQWGRLNKKFGGLLADVGAEGNDNLQAVVKRYALMVMRVGMIFSRIRSFDEGVSSGECYCSDRDFDSALSLVLCCYQHSRLVLTSWPAAHTYALKSPDSKVRFLEALPDTFTNEEATKLALEHGLSSSSFRRYLKLVEGLKIRKLAHGLYEKIK